MVSISLNNRASKPELPNRVCPEVVCHTGTGVSRRLPFPNRGSISGLFGWDVENLASALRFMGRY